MAVGQAVRSNGRQPAQKEALRRRIGRTKGGLKSKLNAYARTTDPYLPQYMDDLPICEVFAESRKFLTIRASGNRKWLALRKVTMLLCTAYLTATLIMVSTPAASEKIEAWQEPKFCPLIDATLVVASLPQTDDKLDSFTAALKERFYGALVLAQICPKAENCISQAPAIDPK